MSVHKWQFTSRFRRHAFGWRSDAPIRRIKEAISEIKQVARKDLVLAAEGAVTFLEKLSPALEHVDSSSGAIGTAVNRTIDTMVPIIKKAEVDTQVRQRWLERLWSAIQDDDIPYIESLGDYWDELCVTQQLASTWADQFLPLVEQVWSPAAPEHGYFKGTSICLASLYAAGRFDELLVLIDKAPFKLWHYRQWGVKALAAMGKKAGAIHYAEDSRGRNEPDWLIAQACEAILRDLIASVPGAEGKWFAAAKSAGLFDVAVELAARSPTDPRTLIRAARDYCDERPGFALESGLAALRWITLGHGYEITSGDVLDAYSAVMEAAPGVDIATQSVKEQIKEMASNSQPGSQFVQKILGHHLSS